MRPTLAWLALALPLAAADPEKPAEFTKEELAVLWAGPAKAAEQEAIFRKYDERLLKLTGEPQYDEAVSLSLTPRPKGAEGALLVNLARADDAAGKELAKALRAQGRTATVYGRASFKRRVEQPTKEYVVPDELKPKGKGADTVRTAADRIQKGILDETWEKILNDARKKGQLEEVTIYGLFSLTGATTDPKKLRLAK